MHTEQYLAIFFTAPIWWDNAVLLKPLGDCRFRQGALLARRDSYYCVLERSAREKGDITEWMVWFPECLCALPPKAFDSLIAVSG